MVATNLDSEISSLLSEAQAVIEALETIKALKLDTRTDVPSEIRVEGIRQQVNSHNTHFKIGKIDPAWIGNVDMSPLRVKVKELQDAHYRLKHPNDIKPIAHQYKRVSDHTKQWRSEFSCLIDDEAFTSPQPVLLGVSAPGAAAPREEFTARFVAYLREEEREVEQMLKKLSKRSTSHLGYRRCRWRQGERVRVCLTTGHAITVANPEQEFVWEGSRAVIDFDVQVDANAPPGPTVLKFDAFMHGFEVATPLQVDLVIRAGAKRGPLRVAKAEAARSAFASYSSTDRQRVLDRLASLRISAGLDPFVDCLSMHPGEEWKPRLAQEIRERELFLLFWSQSAAQSEWVSWEWHTALAEKAAIQPHPLEIGVNVPKELAHLEFGDAFMAVRKAYEQPGAARPAVGE